MKSIFLVCGCLCLISSLSAQITFSEVAANRGIVHTANNTGPGGGVSFADFDGDGWDDLTFATAANEVLHFYRNVNGSFQRLPTLVNHLGDAKQIVWVDYDKDGDKDLFVTTVLAPNRLYENLGDLQLLDVTQIAGLPIENHRDFGACWGDYDRDGWLDLYFNERKSPADSDSNENRLFHNNADGTFTEVTDAAGVADRGRLPFCSAFLDINNDGWPDLFTANDKQTRNTLLLNNGDGTFSDISESSHTGCTIDGMDAGIGDFDNDGLLDIYVSNVEDGSLLHHNLGPIGPAGETVFAEIADDAGVGFYGIGWGGNWLDADLDGYLDFYISGTLSPAEGPSSAFFRNMGDLTFSQPAAGFAGDTVVSYSNAIGDYNQDGYPDIAVLNHAPASSHLWKNSGGTAHWLKVDLRGVLSNRDAIGVRLEVYTSQGYQMRYTHCGIGFLAQNTTTELFGLTDLSSIDSLVITWPTGHRDRLYDVDVDQRILVIEGSTTDGMIYVDPTVQLAVATTDVAHHPFPFVVFPNPVSDRLSWQLPATDRYQYALFDASGRLVRQLAYHIDENSLSVGQLAIGTYTLIAWNTVGDKWLARFVKH